MEKVKITKSITGKVCFGIVLLLLIGSCGEEDQQRTEQIEESTEIEEELSVEEPLDPPIDYTILREWNPDDDPQAVGLEILISENEATKENIENLVKSLSDNVRKAAIKVFQSRQAWQEEQSGEFTDAYDSGYLAYYVKNLTGSGAFQGRNEVRWFQAEGQLEHLMGSSNQL